MVRGRLSVGTFLLAALAGCSGNGALGEGDDIVRGAIVGGATDSNDKPVLGIYINEMALCSGTLIAPNLVLTARHCVAPIVGSGENVDCGTTSFGTTYAASGFLFTWYTDIRDTPDDAWVGATEVRPTTGTTFCGNDAALIILDTNIPSSTAPTIEPRVSSMPMTPEPFKAIGYGLNSPNDDRGSSAGTRRSLGNLEVGCVGDECDSYPDLRGRIETSEWAADAPVCSGDSGGPALDADGKVIGIASRSDAACAFGLYSTVASFKTLIVDAVKDAAEQGGYDPPAWASGGAAGTGGTSSAGAGNGAGGAGNGGTSASGGRGGASGSGGRAGASGSSAMGGSSNAGKSGGDATGGMSMTNGGRASAGRNGSAGTTSTAGAAGTISSNAGTSSMPTTGPGLGDECTSGCAAPYKCYASTGKPPGECVPVCSITTKCPSAYRCDTDLGVCAPLVGQPDSSSDSDDDSVKAKAGCGCRVTPVSDAAGNAWHALGALAVAAAAARRRRRSARA